MKFSVLLSVYAKEKAEYLDRALFSIWDEQSLKPDEIVLVKDGPLTDCLNEIINKWEGILKERFKVIPLESNVGLGAALNEGLKHCSYELVARMDADDISLPQRFEKQISYFKINDHLEIMGSWISEFKSDDSIIYAYRKTPLKGIELYEYAKKRNPLNHMTVMFKKKSVVSVGSYKTFLGFEDYHLWIRMLMAGYKMENISDYLVNARAGDEMIVKRTGIKYLLNEYKFQIELLKLGFINHYEFLSNLFIRSTVRLLPRDLSLYIYSKFLRG